MSHSLERSLKQLETPAPYFVSWMKLYAKSVRRVLRSWRPAVVLALGTLDRTGLLEGGAEVLVRVETPAQTDPEPTFNFFGRGG